MIYELILGRKYLEVSNLLDTIENPFENVDSFKKNICFEKIIIDEQYTIFMKLIHKKLIELDLYEYTSFSKSIFKPILSSAKINEQFLNFFKDFLGHVENLNEEIESQTLSVYLIENSAPVELLKVYFDCGGDTSYCNKYHENLLHIVSKQRGKNQVLLNQYLQLLISKGSDVNSFDLSGHSPLINSLYSSNLQCLEFLLKNGARPDHFEKKGLSAYYVALVQLQDFKIYDLFENYTVCDIHQTNEDQGTLFCDFVNANSFENLESKKVLEKLISLGADLYTKTLCYGRKISPIQIILEKDSGALLYLIEKKLIDLAFLDEDGNSLLHCVCSILVNYDEKVSQQIYKKVKLLINAGCKIDIKNNKEQTAMMLASQDNMNVKTVELLIKSKS